MQFETVIGLEVHAQLKTKTKIFCNCSTQFGQAPNANTCPVCTGIPGALPVLNAKAVRFAVKAALSTNCWVNRKSRFDRKNYFYPDLPKSYQISQYAEPIAEYGFLEVETQALGLRKIGITRIHMEEDAGKLIHDPARSRSMADLNRTGVPLIEIVSEPDIRSPEEAGIYLRKLHSILKYIDVCDGNMEEGSFRCDANISLRPPGQAEFGIRTELKNLNSFKNVEKALVYEKERQAQVLNEGQAVVQETRLWDPAKNRTFSMRGKEEAHDYRYFPDPDLVPLILNETWIKEIENEIPELAEAKIARFRKQYDLALADAKVLSASTALADFFETAAKPLKDKKQAANWMITSLLGLLNAKELSITESPVSPEAVSELLLLIENGKINSNTAKTVFELMKENSESPAQIVREKGLEQVSDVSELESAIMAVINENPTETTAYKAGKTKLFSFFMGQVMKKTKGKADPKMAKKLLQEKIGIVNFM